MKKKIQYFIFGAIILGSTSAKAQPAAVVKAAKAVFTLTTFKKDGSLLASSHGVFVGNNGEAITLWNPLKGADKAVIIDANGNKHNVESIDGANELYDICRIRVEGKTVGASLAMGQSNKNEKVWLATYSVKKGNAKQIMVSNIEKFNTNFNYYILANQEEDINLGCPILNSKGEILGLLQKSTSGNDTHATDGRFGFEQKVTGMSLNDPVLRATGIRSTLPDSHNDALLTMMMAQSTRDSLTHVQYINDFIKKFPKFIEGYTAQAEEFVNSNRFQEADELMKKAISQVEKKEEAYSDYAKVVYQKEIYKSNIPYNAWSLDVALNLANQAYATNPKSIYKHQQAQIIFAKGDYQQAYQMFMELTKSDMRNGEVFYEAAQSKMQMKAPKEEYMALLDSAIAACPQPLTAVAAPYVLARGLAFDDNGEKRKALNDYNHYDSLMVGRVLDPSFYYTRFKVESSLRQYQQALADITRAIIVNPREATYYAEMASLQLRVKMYEQAVATCKRCLQIEPEYADAWLILGIAQKQLGNKVDAQTALQKAKDLGDKRADQYLK
ncbi:tetratricopeptide repeat protein [Prevotella sp.]|uniref:tetratricopeptide repeat protein n=1 Tax=Prevotella sp. TaxID=59823 RepID=UPI002F937D57